MERRGAGSAPFLLSRRQGERNADGRRYRRSPQRASWAQIAECRRPARARGAPGGGPGQEGPRHRAGQAAGHAAAGAAARGGPGLQHGQARGRGGAVGASRSCCEQAALDARLEAERIDVTLPARERPGWPYPSGQPGRRGDRGDLRRHGLCRGRRPGRRGRLAQFRGAQHPARASRAADVRHVLPGSRASTAGRCCCAPTPARCRSAPCWPASRRSGSSLPAAPTAATATPPTRPMFHQVEGLLIDRRTHMGHLKGCLIDFVRAYFERDDVPVRFRPSYFPFTEPSAEVDIGCRRTSDELVVGEGGDWLEILGCGMVHPKRAAGGRPRPRGVAGLRLRHGDRPGGDAEIRHPRPAHLLRLRPALAAPLRLRAAGRAHHLCAGCRDEVHPAVAQGASRDRRVAGRTSATGSPCWASRSRV